MITGLGLELLFGTWLSKNLCDVDLSKLWLTAEVLFPTFMLVAFIQRSVLGWIFCIAALFKIGLPAITSYIEKCSISLQDDDYVMVVCNWLDATGLLFHHGSICFMVSAFGLHFWTLDNEMVLYILTLTIQQWLSPLAHMRYQTIHFLLLLLSEVYMELLFFSSFEHWCEIYDSSAPVATGLLILSHWMWTLSESVRFVNGKMKSMFSVSEERSFKSIIKSWSADGRDLGDL